MRSEKVLRHENMLAKEVNANPQIVLCRIKQVFCVPGYRSNPERFAGPTWLRFAIGFFCPRPFHSAWIAEWTNNAPPLRYFPTNRNAVFPRHSLRGPKTPLFELSE